MLHIHNGDSTAITARQTSLPGEHFAWREALVTGPTPGRLPLEEWKQIRSRHLVDAYEVTAEESLEELGLQHERLASFSKNKEVVLWFEHDLFCQVNLLYLLDWFSRQRLNGTRLSLICIDSFPGIENFRGLGQLNSEQLASLFDTRKEVSDLQLSIAAEAWTAYCSEDPTAIEKFSSRDTEPLPYLKRALRLHLARFPSVRNGLGAVENLVLALIDGGANTFSSIFGQFGNLEPNYGFGDAQVWNDIKRLINAREPLVDVDGSAGSEQKRLPREPKGIQFSITGKGKSVLAGREDFIALNGIDQWLGGVHLENGGPVWRWNQQTEELVMS